MLQLHRASFRQLLVIAFLLIAALLAAVSLRGVYALEQMMTASRLATDRAVQQQSQAQALADRSITMERAARQYLVLNDAVLRDRFDAAGNEASKLLDELSDEGLPADLVEDWRAAMVSVRSQLVGPPATAAERERSMMASFRELAGLQSAMADQLQRSAQARNQSLLNELELARASLARQLVGAILVAVLLALGFGVWLARPLQRLEGAMVRLGENRLDEPIEIRGPADVRLLGRRLDWLRLRLAELDADKARFLRHVSHELKTPLAALREGVSLLEDGVAGRLSDDQRAVARILRQNTQVLQGQIEDLLRFNAMAFDLRRLVRRRTELSQLVERLVEQQKLQWQARRLLVLASGGPLWAEVDEDKLGVAVGNLLSNAIRFSPPGSTIRVRLEDRLEGACIDVHDAGPGVADGDRNRIFEPFYRGERQPDGAIRGSGIGLSIVQETVAAHGGRVKLLPGDLGAHFRIELPHASPA